MIVKSIKGKSVGMKSPEIIFARKLMGGSAILGIL